MNEEKSRQQLVLLAKVAQDMERYHEMLEFMSQLINKYPKITHQEKTLFSIACQNVIGEKRTQWRAICVFAARQTQKWKKLELEHLKNIIEKEQDLICEKVIESLDKLISVTKIPESLVSYHRMKSNYYRYQCDYKTGQEKKQVQKLASQAFQNSQKFLYYLSPTNPIRLGLALSYSAFSYQIHCEREKAVKIAKKAFQDALNELDNLDDQDLSINYLQATTLMQLLRDNITLWTQSQ